MARRELAGLISVQPNAGLPELVDGQTHYPLGAAASWRSGSSASSLEDGVNMIGGCCGTDAAHIAALDAMLRRIGRRRRRGRRPAQRKRVWVPSVASLYGQVPLRQENAYLSIGERCNANGSQAVPPSCRRRATGTAASRWGASRSRKARTRSTSAPPLSGATRSPT